MERREVRGADPTAQTRPCQQALSSREAQPSIPRTSSSITHQWPREVCLHLLFQLSQVTSIIFQVLLLRVLEELQSAVPSSVPHHSQLMGQAEEKSWARVKSLPSTPRQAQRSPATSVFGDRVGIALGCHGLSPLFLPAAPILQPDPVGFPVSNSDPTGKGRNRAMRMKNGVHEGSSTPYSPSLWGRVEPGPHRGCVVTLRGYPDGRGLPQQQKERAVGLLNPHATPS